MKKSKHPEDCTPTELKVTLEAHIVRDLREMEKHSKQTLDQLVSKALLMFIATHQDYLKAPK